MSYGLHAEEGRLQPVQLAPRSIQIVFLLYGSSPMLSSRLQQNIQNLLHAERAEHGCSCATPTPVLTLRTLAVRDFSAS